MVAVVVQLVMKDQWMVFRIWLWTWLVRWMLRREMLISWRVLMVLSSRRTLLGDWGGSLFGMGLEDEGSVDEAGY